MLHLSYRYCIGHFSMPELAASERADVGSKSDSILSLSPLTPRQHHWPAELKSMLTKLRPVQWPLEIAS